jgi:hypothetical protein
LSHRNDKAILFFQPGGLNRPNENAAAASHSRDGVLAQNSSQASKK